MDFIAGITALALLGVWAIFSLIIAIMLLAYKVRSSFAWTSIGMYAVIATPLVLFAIDRAFDALEASSCDFLIC